MGITSSVFVFVVSSVAIMVFGTLLSKAADQLADLSGLGEALFGAIFLGSVTSIPGIITTVVAASNEHLQLAVSNAIGGITVQTFFLAIADVFYLKSNLEHAAASLTNLMQGVLLICLLSLVIVVAFAPELTIVGVHPFSIVIIFIYLLASRMISKAQDKPMWKPRMTHLTVEDLPHYRKKKTNLSWVTVKFVVFALLVGVSGYYIAKSAIGITDQTELSDTFVGSLLTAVSTSLPELIVSIAAVRQGALTLAVGNIIGGNTFDVLFLSFADMAFDGGSIYHEMVDSHIVTIGMAILMTGIIILGLLHREQKGIGKIGWESVLIVLIYVLGNILLFA